MQRVIELGTNGSCRYSTESRELFEGMGPVIDEFTHGWATLRVPAIQQQFLSPKREGYFVTLQEEWALASRTVLLKKGAQMLHCRIEGKTLPLGVKQWLKYFILALTIPYESRCGCRKRITAEFLDFFTQPLLQDRGGEDLALVIHLDLAKDRLRH